jgi:Uma2 family endonuclease
MRIHSRKHPKPAGPRDHGGDPVPDDEAHGIGAGPYDTDEGHASRWQKRGRPTLRKGRPMVQDREEREMLDAARTLPGTPPEGWTLDNLPGNLPKHTELIRGALIMSPRIAWHMEVVDALKLLIGGQCPSAYAVQREMAIRKSLRSAPEPDLSIVRASAVDWDKSVYLPEEVLLVAEVISPESEERDREDKPVMYAMMGLPTYWLIERGKDNAPIVHEHYLYAGVYKLMKTHVDRLTTDVPFPIDIPLIAPTR